MQLRKFYKDDRKKCSIVPNPVYLMGDNKIVLPWGASDVEALLSYFLAMYKSFGVNMAGTRCEQLTPCPNDLNAGANMIILGSEMGLKSTAFIMDVDPAVQVCTLSDFFFSPFDKNVNQNTWRFAGVFLLVASFELCSPFHVGNVLSNMFLY